MDEPEMQYAPDAGLSEHEWASEYATLEPQLVESPIEALPEFADLVERMLVERGVPLDAVGSEGADPELIAGFREAKRVAELSANGEDVPPGDAGSAIADLRALYQSLMGELA